ncbi:MAG TPA: SOS response-associated peptidase [Acidimicrobiales bacterium]|jgi:putative SOS response-associated peptidase YedK|nr:SOS response-associated peptidase [Acidimicrobiales bacterium]
MCGRFTSTSNVERLAEAYAVDEVKTEPLPLRYNVAPSQLVYAVATLRPKEGRPDPVRQLGAFRWGLVPSWAKEPAVANRMINARAEGIESKAAFRRALARRRCIIPADAFYEWQVLPFPSSAGGKAKRSKPAWAVRRRDGEPMAFAGLWELWRPPDDPVGEPLRTCTIITTEANEALAPIHDRMPVILDQSAWDTWLDPAEEDMGLVQRLLVPAPAEWFDAFPVTSRVNKVDNEGPELLEVVPPPRAPAL